MRLRLTPLLAAALLPALASFPGCSSESEGQPCSLANGNNDCNNGLICETPPNGNATNAPAVCCPPAGQPASTPQCSLSGQLDAGNPGAPDSSTFPDTSVSSDGAASSDASDGGSEGRAPDAGSSSDSGTAADVGPG
jgi:hypothetical protein